MADILERSIPLANRIRQDAIRMAHMTHASHIGAVMSVADIVAVLYSGVANVFPDDPKNAARDRIVLSKGHAGMAIYAALAETGFFSRSELNRYYMDGSVYSGHVSHRGIPGVEFSTGSLGQGVCVACGMALSAKIHGKSHHVYAIIGDGENEEGAVWEMALFAAHRELSNFTVVVDHNKMQAMGFCEQEAGLSDLAGKWKSFKWHVVEVQDGNDHAQLISAFDSHEDGKPTVIIANTIKGKGVSYMENNILWHYRDPQGEFYEEAIRELGGNPSCEII
jgi:transketolase